MTHEDQHLALHQIALARHRTNTYPRSSKGSHSLRLRSHDPTGLTVNTPPDLPLLTMDFRAENAVIKESVAIAPNVEILGISVSPPAEPISNGTASRSTSYTCQFFDLSALDDKKYHAVQFQPIIDDANKKKGESTCDGVPTTTR